MNVGATFAKIFVFCFFIQVCQAQVGIYSDALGSMVTGTWANNGTLAQTTGESPYEGNNHYKFSYNFNAWWAGYGLNLNNWGGTSNRNFSAYTHIRLAYRGLTGGELRIRLKTNAIESAEILVGVSTSSYSVVNLPLSVFNNVNLASISEIIFSVTAIQSSVGSVFIDDIRLTNAVAPPPVNYTGANATHTNIKTWARHALMDKGVNCSNWLEAYWMLPNNYPEINKYNRNLIQNLVNAGFKNFRLPVTFERLANNTAPYTIANNTTNQNMWRLVDSMVLWANQMDFTLIICNHHGYSITDANYNTELPRKTAIWNQIMARHSNLNPERFFFELFNEPTNEISNTNLYTFINSLIAAVRAFNTDHTLIVGGNFWNSATGLITSKKYSDRNIIYTFHDYDPYAFTHQGMSWTSPAYMPARAFPLAGSGDSLNLVNSIKDVKTWADTSGVPVMCGEFGCSTSASATSRCNWINTISSALSARGFAYYYWDAISLTDAFGFYNTSNNNMTACFSSALKLGASNTCLKLVTSKADTGPGSLREQLSCASHGDTITFAANLANDTIKLYTSPLILKKNVSLKNLHASPIYISAVWSTPILHIGSGIMSRIENIRILGKESSIIDNKGTLTLLNSRIKRKPQSPFNQLSGTINIQGSSNVIE